MKMEYIKKHICTIILSIILSISLSCNFIMLLTNLNRSFDVVGTYQLDIEYSHEYFVIGKVDEVYKCYKSRKDGVKIDIEGKVTSLGKNIYAAEFPNEKVKYYIVASKEKLLLIRDETVRDYKKIANQMMFSIRE